MDKALLLSNLNIDLILNLSRLKKIRLNKLNLKDFLKGNIFRLNNQYLIEKKISNLLIQIIFTCLYNEQNKSKFNIKFLKNQFTKFFKKYKFKTKRLIFLLD